MHADKRQVSMSEQSHFWWDMASSMVDPTPPETFIQTCYNIIWCFYFWRVLLVITNPPLYDFLLTPLFISGKLTWLQKILEVSSYSPPPIVQGGSCYVEVARHVHKVPKIRSWSYFCNILRKKMLIISFSPWIRTKKTSYLLGRKFYMDSEIF